MSLVSRHTAEGQIAYIVDQDKKICKSKGKTTLTFDGKVYQADQVTGEIVVPYEKESMSGNAILFHNGLAVLTHYDR